MNSKPLRALSLTLLIAGCTPAVPLSRPDNSHSRLQATLTTSVKNGEKSSDKVSIQVQLPASTQIPFKTQAAQTAQAVYVRLTIKAVDLQREYTNAGGVALNGISNLVAFSGGSATLTVEEIPPGKNRIVIAQLYNAEGQELTALRAMGLYHSHTATINASRFTDANPNTNVIEQTVSRRNVPVLSTLEQAINNKDMAFIAQVENHLEALATEFDKLLYGANPPGSTFVTEPQRIDPAEVYSALKTQFQSTALTLPTGLPSFFTVQTPSIVDSTSSVTVHLATPTGFSFTQNLTVVIDDPGSAPVNLNANGLISPQSVTLTNVERGSRRLMVYSNPGNLLLGYTTVTIDPDTGTSFAGNSGASPASPLFLIGGETGIVISSLSQTAAVQNTPVTLNGVGYDPNPNQANNAVKFGTSPATLTGSTNTTANILVPDLIGGTYPVTITRLGVVSNFLNFNLLPEITSLNLTNQRISQPVTLTGTGFHPSSAAANTVTFGSTTVPTADVTPIDGHSLSVNVPAGVSGNQQVRISVGGQQSNLSNFNVRPYVQSVSASSGSIGNTVTLTGTGYAPTAAGNTVTFTRTVAPFTSVTVPSAEITGVSNTSLTLKVPAGVSGAQNITVTVGSQTSLETVPFAVIPTISGFTPSGGAGENITITGTGFSTMPVVQIGGLNAQVQGTPTNTSLTVKVPGNAITFGNKTISVNVEGQIASQGGFAQQLMSPCVQTAYNFVPGDVYAYHHCLDDNPSAPFQNVGLTTNRFGQANRAWDFGGPVTNSYATLSYDISPSSNDDLTLSVWTRALGNPVGTHAIIGQDNTPWDRAIALDNRGPNGFGWSAFAGSSDQVIGGGNYADAVWVMLTAVYDQSAQTARFYVNGNLVGSGNNANLTSGTSQLVLGKHAVDGSEYYHGTIDDVLVFNIGLTQAQIQELYNRTKP